ncbi:MAG: Gfo/Idh/MocA family oxidoreductase [Candidatus Hydrogenedentota bacterium]
MSEEISREKFVKGTVAGAMATGLIGTSKTSWAGANDRIRVAQVGIRGRGNDHTGGWNRLKNVEIDTICDVDTRLFDGYIKKNFKRAPEPKKKVQDMRDVIDDKDIDVVSIATPNHWHSLAAIWAMEAGKDVYVEKPCSHNVFEGRQMVNAARKHDRICQHGTQIRSSAGIQEGIKHIRDGLLGEVYMARGLCYRWRGSIGTKPDSDVPKGVDYNLWQGPAEERAFSENRFHYNWHYHWAYGNGDIGNQGVHQMDICRWGLGVEHPNKVTSGSGMYLFDDDKEVPNVISTTFNFDDAGERGKIMAFDVRPWMTNDEKNAKVGVLFYGSEGYMVIDSYSHYKTYLGRDETPGPENNKGGDHYGNFIEAVRAHDRSILNAEIEEGHYSASLAHLGLISAKLGRTVNFDPKAEQITGDSEANSMLTRDYRKPFIVNEIKV